MESQIAKTILRKKKKKKKERKEKEKKRKEKEKRSSHHGSNPTRNHELVGLIPGLAQWVKDLALRWL